MAVHSRYTRRYHTRQGVLSKDRYYALAATCTVAETVTTLCRAFRHGFGGVTISTASFCVSSLSYFRTLSGFPSCGDTYALSFVSSHCCHSTVCVVLSTQKKKDGTAIMSTGPINTVLTATGGLEPSCSLASMDVGTSIFPVLCCVVSAGT